MKKLITVASIFFAFNASAAVIQDSDLSARHQDKIVKAVLQKCKPAGKTSLRQISNKIETVKVDQGITDQFFTTTLELRVSPDQSILDVYNLTVQSAIYDTYSHEDADWGSISVEAIIGCNN